MAVFFVALLLLNGKGIDDKASTLEYGRKRDALLALTTPLRRVFRGDAALCAARRDDPVGGRMAQRGRMIWRSWEKGNDNETNDTHDAHGGLCAERFRGRRGASREEAKLAAAEKQPR